MKKVVTTTTGPAGLTLRWVPVTDGDRTRMEMRWNARRPMGLTGLPDEALRAPPPVRLAWLLGRTTIEGLEPAGVF